MSKARMTLTAGADKIRVDYRLANKSYGVAAENSFDDGERTSHPFDSADVNPGETFELPDGADLVRVVTYTEAAGPADTSMAG